MNFRVFYYVVLGFIGLLCVLLFMNLVHRLKTMVTTSRSVEHICVAFDEALEVPSENLVETDALCEGKINKAAWTLNYLNSFVYHDGETYTCYRVDYAVLLAKNGQLPLDKRIVCEIRR